MEADPVSGVTRIILGVLHLVMMYFIYQIYCNIRDNRDAALAYLFVREESNHAFQIIAGAAAIQIVSVALPAFAGYDQLGLLNPALRGITILTVAAWVYGFYLLAQTTKK